jgi:hypothetical protein
MIVLGSKYMIIILSPVDVSCSLCCIGYGSLVSDSLSWVCAIHNMTQRTHSKYTQATIERISMLFQVSQSVLTYTRYYGYCISTEP